MRSSISTIFCQLCAGLWVGPPALIALGETSAAALCAAAPKDVQLSRATRAAAAIGAAPLWEVVKSASRSTGPNLLKGHAFSGRFALRARAAVRAVQAGHAALVALPTLLRITTGLVEASLGRVIPGQGQRTLSRTVSDSTDGSDLFGTSAGSATASQQPAASQGQPNNELPSFVQLDDEVNTLRSRLAAASQESSSGEYCVALSIQALLAAMDSWVAPGGRAV